MYYITLLLIIVIYVYKFLISPFIGFNCRFYPSCSQYSIDALKNFGLLKAILLIFKRILKCHPLNKGGIDKIPIKYKNNNKFREH